MSWRDVRKVIAEALAEIEIAEPAASGVVTVYESPPASIVDWPCFVIYPPAVDVGRSGARRDKAYTFRCRLLLKDADQDVAADLSDAFREAAVDAFDEHVYPGGGVLTGQRCDEVGTFDYGGTKFIGFDCFLTVNISEGADFQP